LDQIAFKQNDLFRQKQVPIWVPGYNILARSELVHMRRFD